MAAVFVLAAVGVIIFDDLPGFHSGLRAPRVLGTGLMPVGQGQRGHLVHQSQRLVPRIWDPAVYYFAEPQPNGRGTALTTAIGAVVQCRRGGVPCGRAVDVDPVEALRHDEVNMDTNASTTVAVHRAASHLPHGPGGSAGLTRRDLQVQEGEWSVLGSSGRKAPCSTNWEIWTGQIVATLHGGDEV